MILHDYQQPHVAKLLAILSERRVAHDGSDAGCHAAGTPILLHDGTIKHVESIIVGDVVMGSDGEPQSVTELKRGREDMALITPVKGELWSVNLSHILTLVQTGVEGVEIKGVGGGALVDVTVKEWLSWSRSKKHIFKIVRRGVDTWPKSDQPIDPYSLGALLGDGSFLLRYKAVTLSKPGPEMKAVAVQLGKDFSARVWTQERNDGTDNPSHYIVGKRIPEILSVLGLWQVAGGEKFVPSIYKIASVDQRLAVLAGLLDTDGSLCRGGYDFISKSQRLSEDVTFIARSLGLAAYIKECRKGCQTGVFGTYWRVAISGETSRIPCRIPRKIAPKRSQKKDVLRTGFSVKLLPNGYFFGFSLSGSGRFLLGDFTVTHNTGKTFCAAAVAAELNLETLVICPLSVVPTWRKVLELFGVKATVINYELAWRRLGVKVKCGRGFFFTWSRAYPLVIYDEAHRAGGETTINSKMLIASRRNGSRILTLSATAADTVMKMKAIGFSLGLHSLSDYRDWLIRFGAVEKPLYGRGGKPVKQKNGLPVMKLEIGARANSVAMQVLHEQIYGGISPRGSRMRIADIPNFPKTRIEIRMLEGASKDLRSLSDELQSYIAQRNALGKVSEDILAKLVFWRQAAETAKIPHFLEMAEDAIETSRVAIFVNFNRTVDELLAGAAERGWSTAFIRGDQNADERQAAIVAFQSNKIDLIVCNIQAGGVGVSLHDPVTMVPRTAFFSPPWSAKDLKQGFGRVHRDGGGVSRQFLVFWDSGIEARVAASVQRKLNDLSLLNDSELDGSFQQQVDDKISASAQATFKI